MWWSWRRTASGSARGGSASAAARPGQRPGAAQLGGQQRELIPGVAGQQSFGHAIRARGARGEPSPGCAYARSLPPTCSSRTSAQSASTGSVPSARRPARMRRLRTGSPARTAAPSWKTSKRALSALLAATSAALTVVPAGSSSASLSISCRAASRLPSLRSASSAMASSGRAQCRAAQPRAQPLRQSRAFDRPDRQPRAARLHGPHPAAPAASRSSASVTISSRKSVPAASR